MLQIKKEKVFIKKLNTELGLDFFTLAVDSWMLSKYSEDQLQKALSEFDSEIILDLFWKLLDDESKRKVAKVKVIEWEGMEEKELLFDEPTDKLKHLISGADELMKIWMALVNTKKKSIPDVDENAKKKVTEEKQ